MLLLEGSTGTITALAYAPDSQMLAVGSSGGLVRLLDGHGDATPLAVHIAAVQALTYSPDGAYLVSGGADRALHIWDIATKRPIFAALNPEPCGITSVAFVGPRTLVFGIGEYPGPVARPTTMFIHQIGQPKWRPFPFRVVHGIRAIAGDAERRLAVWATDTKQLHVQDISRQPTRPQILRNDCRALALSSDARWVAVASDWEVLLYDLQQWPSPAIPVGRHLGLVDALAFSPDNRTLFSGSWDKTVRAWDVEQRIEKACFTWPVGRIAALAIAPDGLRAAAAGDSGTIAVWDLDE